MSDYNERLDEIFLNYDKRCPKCYDEGHGGDGCDYCWTHRVEKDAINKSKRALTPLIKELVAEAKPGRADTQIWHENPDDAWDMAIDQFEQNLLKALEEV